MATDDVQFPTYPDIKGKVVFCKCTLWTSNVVQKNVLTDLQ